jgi:hypothetical protein
MTKKTARATHHPHVHFIGRTVNYNDDVTAGGLAAGFYVGTLPKGALITQAGGNIETAFNAGSTNVLTLGLEGDSGLDDIVGASGFTEGTPGGYVAPYPKAPLSAAKDVYVSYLWTGATPTTGKAHVLVEYAPKLY